MSKVNFPSADIVIVPGQAPSPIVVSIMGHTTLKNPRREAYTFEGGGITGQAEITHCDYIEGCASQAEWKVANRSGRIQSIVPMLGMTTLCLDKIFGRGRWKLEGAL